ncbi:SDR family NAD(P)-dependent oxidoreductase [Parasphingorhabdus pacifica]
MPTPHDHPGTDAEDPAAESPRPAPPPEWQERITPGRFTGSTVIVTGAGSGIGRATASRVAREGGRVVAVDIALEELDEFVAAHAGQDIVPVHADITTDEGIAAILAAVDGRVDALANVVGITDAFMPLHEVSDELWQRVFDVNLNGMFRLTRAVLPTMLGAGRGAIVNVASEAALRGSTAGAAYTTSKHAVVGLTRSAAFMYGASGIRVNAVAPGAVMTNIEGSMGSDLGRERVGPILATIPGIAEAAHLAASITFLLSEDSVNINGGVLPSDGGWSVQ